jgi:hypothetical protein
MVNFISGIIGLTVGVVIFANVFVSTVKGVNTSTWQASEVSMWNLLTLIGIVGLVYAVLAVFGLAGQ